MTPLLTTYSNEVGVFGVSDGDDGVHLLNQLLLLLIFKLHVPLGKPRLARPILNQDEPDLPKKETLALQAM